MKKLILIFALLFSVGVITPTTQQTTTRYYIGCEYENLTIDATAGGVAFTASEYQSSACIFGAQSVTFTIECSGGGTTCPIRMMLDGTTTVTSSVGMRADYGQSVTIYGLTSIIRFRAIREGATSAILNVQYFR